VRSPLGKGPNPHALPAAISAAVYLGVPADTEFIKAFVRGIIIAISAKTTDRFRVDFRRNLTAPGEVRGCPPSFEPCDQALPASEMHPAATPATLVCRGETNSTKNTSEGERQGKSDHRVLLRDADIAASTMPAARVGRRRELDIATGRATGTATLLYVYSGSRTIKTPYEKGLPNDLG
jgi:hypothetical protein